MSGLCQGCGHVFYACSCVKVTINGGLLPPGTLKYGALTAADLTVVVDPGPKMQYTLFNLNAKPALLELQKRWIEKVVLSTAEVDILQAVGWMRGWISGATKEHKVSICLCSPGDVTTYSP